MLLFLVAPGLFSANAFVKNPMDDVIRIPHATLTKNRYSFHEALNQKFSFSHIPFCMTLDGGFRSLVFVNVMCTVKLSRNSRPSDSSAMRLSYCFAMLS